MGIGEDLEAKLQRDISFLTLVDTGNLETARVDTLAVATWFYILLNILYYFLNKEL